METFERKPEPAPPSHAAAPGVSKIMAGGDLTQNISHTNTTTVLNQDETKKVQTCAVSGRQAEITKGHVCPSCGLWVHGDCFDHDTKLCTTCNSHKAKGAQQTFKDKVSEFLSDDQISQDEIQFLREFGGRLNIHVAEQDNIIAAIKKERVQDSTVPLSRIEKVRFDKAAKVLLDYNYEDTARLGKAAAMANLESIYDRHPNNMEVAGTLLLAYMIAPMAGGDGLRQVEGRWADKVLQLLKTSPAFSHDTEAKFLYTCMSAGGLLLADRMAKQLQQHALSMLSQEQLSAAPEFQPIQTMLLSADEYRQMDQLSIDACSELEKAFPESDEWLCVELMLMFEEYFANGHDPAIKSEILQIIPETAGEIPGDIGAVLQIVRSKLSQDDTFALLEKDKREGLSGFGQMIYYSLFCSFMDLAEDLQVKMGEVGSPPSGKQQEAVEEQTEEEQTEENEIVLNLAVAQEYLENPDKYDLSRVTAITDEAAEALSIARGEIDLSGLTAISDVAARALANMHEYSDLYLDGLTTLSVAAAQALAGHKGNILSLKGLVELSDDAARSLASNQKEPGYLVLNDYMEHHVQSVANAPPAAGPPPLPAGAVGPPPPPAASYAGGGEAALEECQQRFQEAVNDAANVDRIFFTGSIPQKKLGGAIKGYLPVSQAEEVLFLYDDTVFGGAKEGLCLTRDSIHFKGLGEAAKSLHLSKISNLKVRLGTATKMARLIFNLHDGSVAEYRFTSNEERGDALERLLQIALDTFNIANA